MLTDTTSSLIFKIYRLRRKEMKQSYKALDLTVSQVATLRAAEDNPGCMQKDLSDAIDVSPPVMVGILGALEDKGLIERKMDPNSRRVLRIYLTPDGKKMAKKITRIADAATKKLFNNFTDEELKELNAYLSRACDNF